MLSIKTIKKIAKQFGYNIQSEDNEWICFEREEIPYVTASEFPDFTLDDSFYAFCYPAEEKDYEAFKNKKACVKLFKSYKIEVYNEVDRLEGMVNKVRTVKNRTNKTILSKYFLYKENYTRLMINNERNERMEENIQDYENNVLGNTRMVLTEKQITSDYLAKSLYY